MLPLLAMLAHAAPGFGDPLDRCKGPADTLGERLRARTACLIAEAGPRSAASPAGRAAMRAAIARDLPPDFAVDQLDARFPTLIACRRGERADTVLLLAHVDAVADAVPGAADNASSIAILLDVADALPAEPPRTVCLAFPDGEELGMRGSLALKNALTGSGRSFAQGLLRAETLELVVSLDLIGRGALTWNGLGPAWDAARLRALLAVAPADVPWVYRARSRRYPTLERSDHAPFTVAGFPAVHLMTRGDSGITWSYHTPQDDVEALDPATLQRARDLVFALAMSDAPGDARRPGEAAAVLPMTNVVIPGWAVMLGLLLAAGATIAAALHRPTRQAGLRGFGRALMTLIAIATLGAAAGLAAAAGRPIGGTLAGPVAAAVWLGSSTGLLALGAGSDARVRAMIGGAGSLVLGGALLALGHPLLALPLALAAAGATWAARLVGLHAPESTASTGRWRAWDLLKIAAVVPLATLALWPSGYFVRPGAFRELLFHGLVPTDLALPLLCALLLMPAALSWLPVERLPAGRIRGAALAFMVALTLGAIGVGLLSPPWAEPYAERDWRWPDVPSRRPSPGGG